MGVEREKAPRLKSSRVKKWEVTDSAIVPLQHIHA